MALRLGELFSAERIKVNLQAEDKSEVFEELVDLLSDRYSLDCRDEILEAVRRREEKMSTGIKRGIAIPHAKTGFTRGVIGVIGVSRAGIDYASLDGEPVHLLFLVVSSEQEAAAHLAALKKIALLVEQPSFLQEMIRAADPEAANGVIRSFEGVLNQGG
jgi:PTS system fructose-specific IIC component/PTS system nitrogen regulatory IIA component